MKEYTLRLSEETYQRLLQYAAQLHSTPEQVVVQFIESNLMDRLPREADAEVAQAADADTEAVLAAVERLTHTFADLTIPNIEQVLADPMLASSGGGLHR